ncbi:MAG: CDP-diacylglycerol--serine O-phosphatidyltransferase [Bdellovibrionota bacterium]
MRKIYFLPNLFTTANMFCGFYAVVVAIHGNFLTAAWMILVAMIFDSMDGRVARLTRATSAFGVEYDSLSDLLSFGVAPALVTYLWCLEPFGRLGWLAAFLYVVCAALRLARFNVLVNAVPKKYFQGLPSPLAAATVATAVIFYTEMGFTFAKESYMLAVILVLASLMISTIRFPSFKEFKVSKENSFGVLAVCILTLVLIAVKPEVTLFVMCLAYVVIGMLVDFFRFALGRRTKAASTAHAVKSVNSQGT